LKPRILFPTEEQLKAKEERIAKEAAEEALTDIEGGEESEVVTHAQYSGPASTSIPAERTVAVLDNANESKESNAQSTFDFASTPSTRIDLSFSTQTSETVSFSGATAPTNKHLQKPKRGGRARSPFDKWGHAKRASGDSIPTSSKLSAGAKREGSPLEKSPGPGKRVRSGVGPLVDESSI
jgi:hypothetical protein